MPPLPPGQQLINNAPQFMQDNIVIVQITGDTSGGDLSITNGVQPFKLYSLPTVTGRKRNWRKTSVGVYFLHPFAAPVYYPNAVADNTQIDAFFCPYEQGKTMGTMISNQANLTFTTQMDGCTFGVGSTTPGGHRLVYHTNKAAVGDPNNPWVQQNAQDTSLRGAFAGAHHMLAGALAPSGYRTSARGTSYQATTFGVRTGNGTWDFYTQRYTIDRHAPRRYSLKEVVQFY
jgi:hypothetical protein